MENLEVVIKMPIVRTPVVEVESEIAIKSIKVQIISKWRISVRGEDKSLAFMVEGTETISKLKAMILNHESISADYISILFDDKELDDSRSLVDCGICEDSILNFRTVDMRIFVKKHVTEDTIPLYVNNSDTIGEIKQKIREKWGIPENQEITLMHHGPLQDYMSIAHCDFQVEDTITLFISPNDG